MYLFNLIFSGLLYIVFCFHENELCFSLEYFNYKEVKSILLLSDSINKNNYIRFAKQISTEYKSISVFFTQNINIDSIQEVFMNYNYHQGILIRSNNVNFLKIMQIASENMLFNDNNKWLIIHDESNCDFDRLIHIDDYNETQENITANNTNITTCTTNITSYNMTEDELFRSLRNLDIHINSDVTVAIESNNFTNNLEDTDYILYDVYNYGPNHSSQLNIEMKGRWKTDEGLTYFSNEYKYYERWDFKQMPIRTIVVSSNPKEFHAGMLTNYAFTTDVNVITKISTAIFFVLAEQHNFSFQFSVSDRWIGTFAKNSTRVVANSLHFREQDLTPLLRITSDLVGKIGFVHPPLTSIETKYYYRIPNSGVGKYENQFLTPLDSETWWCILATLAICFGILGLAAKLELRGRFLQYALFSVMASVCQQFFDDAEERNIFRASLARRITVFITGTSCVLLYNFYTSSVVSWLLSGPPPSINSLQELLESPLELVFENVGYTKSWLQVPGYYYNKRNAKVEDQLRKKKVFNKKKTDPLILSLDEGITYLKAGGYAFHAQVANANHKISQSFSRSELCELGSLQSMENTALYPAVQSGSPYKEFLTWSLSRLRERGHVSRTQRRLQSPDISCDGSTPRPLGLGGAAPAFILLAMGFLAATVVLVLECVSKSMESKRRLFSQ